MKVVQKMLPLLLQIGHNWKSWMRVQFNVKRVICSVTRGIVKCVTRMCQSSWEGSVEGDMKTDGQKIACQTAFSY